MRRGDLAEELIKANPAATLDFVLALLEEDVSPVVRAEILDELEKTPIHGLARLSNGAC